MSRIRTTTSFLEVPSPGGVPSAPNLNAPIASGVADLGQAIARLASSLKESRDNRELMQLQTRIVQKSDEYLADIERDQDPLSIESKSQQMSRWLEEQVRQSVARRADIADQAASIQARSWSAINARTRGLIIQRERDTALLTADDAIRSLETMAKNGARIADLQAAAASIEASVRNNPSLRAGDVDLLIGRLGSASSAAEGVVARNELRRLGVQAANAEPRDLDRLIASAREFKPSDMGEEEFLWTLLQPGVTAAARSGDAESFEARVALLDGLAPDKVAQWRVSLIESQRRNEALRLDGVVQAVNDLRALDLPIEAYVQRLVDVPGMTDVERAAARRDYAATLLRQYEAAGNLEGIDALDAYLQDDPDSRRLAIEARRSALRNRQTLEADRLIGNVLAGRMRAADAVRELQRRQREYLDDPNSPTALDSDRYLAAIHTLDGLLAKPDRDQMKREALERQVQAIGDIARRYAQTGGLSLVPDTIEVELPDGSTATFGKKEIVRAVVDRYAAEVYADESLDDAKRFDLLADYLIGNGKAAYEGWSTALRSIASYDLERLTSDKDAATRVAAIIQLWSNLDQRDPQLASAHVSDEGTRQLLDDAEFSYRFLSPGNAAGALIDALKAQQKRRAGLMPSLGEIQTDEFRERILDEFGDAANVRELTSLIARIAQRQAAMEGRGIDRAVASAIERVRRDYVPINGYLVPRTADMPLDMDFIARLAAKRYIEAHPDEGLRESQFLAVPMHDGAAWRLYIDDGQGLFPADDVTLGILDRNAITELRTRHFEEYLDYLAGRWNQVPDIWINR